MIDYEELIEMLMYCSDMKNDCDLCKYAEVDHCRSVIMHEAAVTIEDLLAKTK